MVDSVDEATKAVIVVSVGVWRIRSSDGGIPKAGSNDDGKAGWNQVTPPSENELRPSRRVL
jgi:hypothetical protein